MIEFNRFMGSTDSRRRSESSASSRSSEIREKAYAFAALVCSMLTTTGAY